MSIKKYNIFIIALLVLVIATFVLIGGKNTYSTIADATVNVGGEQCAYIEGGYGQITCTPTAGSVYDKPYVRSVDAIDYRGKGNIITCGKDMNTPSCGEIFVHADVHSGNSARLLYQVTNVAMCPVGGDKWCGLYMSPDYTNPSAPNKYQTTFVKELYYGEQFVIGGIDEFWIIPFFNIGWVKGKVKVLNVPYGLLAKSSEGVSKWMSPTTCSLYDALETKNTLSFCLTGDCMSLKKTGGNNEDITSTYRLSFGDWVNYIDSYYYKPLDPGLIGSGIIENYKGQGLAKCEIGIGTSVNIRSISKIKTTKGCYLTPDKIINPIGSEDCCPGQETANARCNDNFKWVTTTYGQCSTDKDCDTGYYCDNAKHCTLIKKCQVDTQCAGQGGYVTDYSQEKPTLMKYACQNSQCVKVETKEVDCTSAKGCKDGQVCDLNTYKCVGTSGGAGGDPKCGDAICSTGENIISCPQDCVSGNEWLSSFLFFVVFILFGGLLFYATTRDTLWAVIGAIIGLAVAFTVQWFLANWLAIILGSAVIGVAGGIILYFFGGVIVVIIGIILQLVNLLKGGK